MRPSDLHDNLVRCEVCGALVDEHDVVREETPRGYNDVVTCTDCAHN